MLHTLDWSHAFTERFSSAADRQHNAASLAPRLRHEMNAGLLPCLTLPYAAALEKDLSALEPWLAGFKHMLLLGIGGSALGARALQNAFSPGQDAPEHQGKSLWILDNVCSDTLEHWLATLPPKETVVLCISKSGGTIETLAQYFLVRQWLEQALPSAWKEHLLLITDAAKGFLREEAQQKAIRSLEVPDNLGGRYSALSAVGLAPAAFLGIDWRALLRGAAGLAQPLVQALGSDAAMQAALGKHAALGLATWAHALEAQGYSQLIFFCYMPQWATFGPWFAQLWAESLGKEGKGLLPVPAVGVTDQHSVNQMFLDGAKNKACLFVSCPALPQGRSFPSDMPEQWAWLRGKHFGDLLAAEALGTRMALCSSGMPLVQLCPHDASPESAGALMLLLEASTILTGWLLGINPIDQPAVELGKRLANARLGAQGYAQEQQALAAYLATPAQEQAF